MTEKNKLHDVFLYRASSDSDLAIAVKQKFDAEGLPTVLVGEVNPAKKQMDALLREIETTRSFVVLCTPRAIQEQSLPFLIGAAWGGGMPIFTLRSDVASYNLPAYLMKYDDFELWDGMPNLFKKIRTAIRPLTDEQLETLIDCYREIGVPIEDWRNSVDPRETLAEMFHERAESKLDEDRLIRELRRLKVLKKLPKLTVRTAG